MQHKLFWSAVLLLTAGLSLWLSSGKNPLTPGLANHPYNAIAASDLLDPNMAPEDLKPLVMRGFHILLETQKYVPEYAGDRLTCSNCHFNCGNTLGGSNGGISLVGVTHVYPRELPENKLFTLQDRINACFEKSMNGKPLPVDSEPMNAMMAYLAWISQRAPSNPPWLKLKPLRSRHVGDADRGQLIYAAHCALCHGRDGQGQPRDAELSYPPLWGESSFNARAGMNTMPLISAFVYENMPYEQAFLSVEEALDVAVYVLNQPRPE